MERKKRKFEFTDVKEVTIRNPVYTLIINEKEITEILKKGRLFPPWLVGPKKDIEGENEGKIVYETGFVFPVLGPKEVLLEAEKWEKTEYEKSGFHTKALIEITPQIIKKIKSGEIYYPPIMYGNKVDDEAVSKNFSIILLGLKTYQKMTTHVRSVSDSTKFMIIKGDRILDPLWNEVDLVVAHDSLPKLLS